MQINGMCVNRTDHMIIPHGTERMVLGDQHSGQAIIVAERTTEDIWTITAPWADAQPTSADTRAAAITAMTDLALMVCPGAIYSTFVPQALEEMP